MSKASASAPRRRRAGVTRSPAPLLLILLAAMAASGPAAARGQPEPSPAAAPPAGAAAELPLSRAVLFSSGVTYFERDGEVTGNQTADFLFAASDVNDLLKSMVVRDLDGGVVSGVRYASKDPLDKSLKGFPIDLTDDPGLAAILTQARGEGIDVNAPERLTGTIVGVEERPDGEGRSAAYLNLLTESGLRSVRLDSAKHLRFTDERLDHDLREALALLARSHDRDKRRVSVAFAGQGRRRVRIGYLLASPVWKTSYRLVLADQDGRAGGGGQQPLLQGWGIVENTTDEDWKDVRISLIAGRPISFVMDLYQPLYVPRPEVKPESYASLAPQTYEQDLSQASKALAAPRAAPAPSAARGAPMAEAAPFAPEERFDISRGVQAMAQAGDVGSFFQYAIDRPVTLARHESAMLPIVNKPVDAQRVSIYNQSVLAKHPLLGARLRNTAGVDLMAGPITVFDGGVYAGDAQIDDLPAGAERLISFAVDLETEVATAERSVPEDLLSVRVLRGTLIATRLQRKERAYTVKSTSARPRDLLIEHPLDPNWALVSPEAEERTRDSYRFAVHLPAASGGSSTASLTVAEKRTVSQTVLLNSASDDTIAFYLQARESSGKVKDALRALAARRAALAETVAQRQEEERKQQQITADQSRVRENMARLDHDAALYKRYVAQLDSQENELAQMRDRIDSLRQRELEQRKALEDAIRSMDAE